MLHAKYIGLRLISNNVQADNMAVWGATREFVLVGTTNAVIQD